LFYIDIAFKQQKLAIEIDGRLHETDKDLFESDRWRQNALIAAGWRVLRFTMSMLRDHPEAFITAILDALHRKHITVGPRTAQGLAWMLASDAEPGQFSRRLRPRRQDRSPQRYGR
jgi:hypothetical protein